MLVIFMVFLLIVVAGFGQAVLHLWNWLMPDLFGLRAISFWQAVGLLGLSWLFFGGFGWMGRRPRREFAFNRGRHGDCRRMTGEQRAQAREAFRAWMHMAPEERERFRNTRRAPDSPSPETDHETRP
jgi:hypothetical protein